MPAPRADSTRTHAGQRGAALVIALLIAAVISAFAIVLIATADVETLLVGRNAEREQLLQAAESGARAVKRWFDAPVSGPPDAPRHAFLGRYDVRRASWFIRDRRLIDADGDDATPPIPADGTPGREFWRQGRTVDAAGSYLDLFHRPSWGSRELALLGTPEGPDLLLGEEAGRDFLDDLNDALLAGQPRNIRISRIAVYAPPRIPATGTPLGIATVEVTASRYRRLARDGVVPDVPDGEEPLGRCTVRVGLAAVAPRPPGGPLAACGSLTVTGRLRARWGRVSASRNVQLAPEGVMLDDAVSSGWPLRAPGRHLDSDATVAWIAAAGGRVEDPWLEVHAGENLVGFERLPDQPLPYDPAIVPHHDHSNLFQRSTAAACPAFAYHAWKRLAMSGLSGDEGLEYFAFDPSTGLYRRWGEGPARSVRDWTDGREGIFFFDTADARPPDAGNLAPPVLIEGGSWSVAGVIVLHARSFGVRGAAGSPRTVLPPGEPFEDANGSGDWETGENHLNFDYPSLVEADPGSTPLGMDPLAGAVVSVTDPEGETVTVSTTPRRDPRGTPRIMAVNLFGLLFNAGDILAEGDAVHYGALVAGRDVIQETPGADSPVVLYDGRLATGEWPPPEIAMPRTRCTFWHARAP